jgi:hypothetical protein
VDPAASYLDRNDDQSGDEPYGQTILDQGGGGAIPPKATREHMKEFPAHYEPALSATAPSIKLRFSQSEMFDLGSHNALCLPTFLSRSVTRDSDACTAAARGGGHNSAL